MTPTDEFIDDVKKSVRQDQVIQAWKNYGNTIITVILTIILFTGGYLFWNSYQENKLNKQTLVFEAALQDPQALGTLDQLIDEGSQGYKILALFTQAKAELSTFETAEKKLQTVQSSKAIEPFYRDVAALEAVMVKFDSTNAAVLLEELSDLAHRNGPLQPAALELKGFAHMKLKQGAAAAQAFSAVENHPAVPRAMKLRARAMQEILNK